jgi:hypothetical protein
MLTILTKGNHLGTITQIGDVVVTKDSRKSSSRAKQFETKEQANAVRRYAVESSIATGWSILFEGTRPLNDPTYG